MSSHDELKEAAKAELAEIREALGSSPKSGRSTRVSSKKVLASESKNTDNLSADAIQGQAFAQSAFESLANSDSDEEKPKKKPQGREEPSLNEPLGPVDDLADFDVPPKKRFSIFWVLLLLVTLAGAAYWFFPVGPEAKVYFSDNFLEDEQVSEKTDFAISDRLIVTYDNLEVIDAKYLQIFFSQVSADGTAKFYEKQKKSVVPGSKRVEILYQKRAFENWGPGQYKIEIKDPAGRLLAESVLNITD